MPETKSEALKRAKAGGFKKSDVVKSKDGKYFISPKGLKKEKSKKLYADLRAAGNSKEKSAKITWAAEKGTLNRGGR